MATCVRLGIPALADLAYLGAGGTFATPTRRPPRKELTARQRSLNRAHAEAAGLCYPVQRQLINRTVPVTPYRATLLSVDPSSTAVVPPRQRSPPVPISAPAASTA